MSVGVLRTSRGAARTLLTLLGCALVLWLLPGLSTTIDYHSIVEALRRIPSALVWVSVVITGLSYLAIVVRDGAALKYVGGEVPRSALLLASFCASALGNAVGLSPLSGHAVRDRIYGAAKIQPEQISRLMFFIDVGFGLY